MRATAQDRDASAMMGINVDRTISFTFALGGALAGAGGVIYALYIGTSNFQLGFRLGLFAFTAAVLGGIGNLTGAVLGGVAARDDRRLQRRLRRRALDDDDHLLDPDPDPRLPPVGPARRADAGRPVVTEARPGSRALAGATGAGSNPRSQHGSSWASLALVVLTYPYWFDVPVDQATSRSTSSGSSSTS